MSYKKILRSILAFPHAAVLDTTLCEINSILPKQMSLVEHCLHYTIQKIKSVHARRIENLQRKRLMYWQTEGLNSLVYKYVLWYNFYLSFSVPKFQYVCVIQQIYRASQEEWTNLRESVPYVELYRYNPKHVYPKLNGYGDNGQRSLKLWQLLHTYWLPNTYSNWQKYVVSVMLISVLNIKVTCECKAIKLNYKNTRTTVVFVLRFTSNVHRPQLFVISPRSLHSDVS